MKAAEWLGHKKTEAPMIPMVWIYKAIDYMSAEAEAQEIINNRKK
jgi:hypothetical protein